METALPFLALTGVGIFLSSWLAGALSICFAIYESIAVLRFHPPAFAYGKRVVRRSGASPDIAGMLPVGEVVRTRGTRFKLIDGQTCLFFKNRQWGEAVLHTPFPLKGTLRIKSEVFEAEGRLPLGTSVFLIAWLAGWTGGGMMVFGATPENFMDGIWPLLMGGLVGGTFIAAIFYEIQCFEKRTDEIVAYLLETDKAGNDLA